MNAPVHPLIRELFKLLPPAGSEWPEHAQRHWLDAAEAIMNLIYEDTQPETAEPPENTP